jgi:hypothetical protein
MANKLSSEESEEEAIFEPEPIEGENSSDASTDGQKLELAVRILKRTIETIQRVVDLLDTGDIVKGREALVSALSEKSHDEQALDQLQADRVIEGVFDGEKMIGPDGQTYQVPVNYASKSRLVEGDILKLVIRQDGAFVYKQIGPVERRRVQARLVWDASSGSYAAIDKENDKVWKVLNASISYFKGQEGDTVLVLVPKTAPSVWAAVENVVRK